MVSAAGWRPRPTSDGLQLAMSRLVNCAPLPCRPEDRDPMQRTRTSYDKPDARRDRRYPIPMLRLKIGDTEYGSGNWSLGGFMLLDYAAPVRPGAILEGELRFEGTHSARFVAEVMRVGPADGEIGARFRELGDAAFDLLDRALIRRLFRGRAAG
jgi:hypothetical protein